MNLVLFDSAEIDRPLPLADERARHIRTVLRCADEELFDVGLVNGPRGKARIVDERAGGLILDFTWQPAHPAPPRTRLVVGFPRPQTARDVLRDATTLGATDLAFVSTRRSDPNYAKSSLWISGEWTRHIRTGAAQAFDTYVPEVGWTRDLPGVLSEWSDESPQLIALDVYGQHSHLADLKVTTPTSDVAITIGPERGWEDTDRQVLTEFGAKFFSLGDRVLRTETAVTAALTLLTAARVRAGKSPP